MSRRLFLPLTPDPTSRPTVDAVRRRLGGRATTEPGAGEVVAFHDDRGGERLGVVLFVRGEDLDVWVEGDTVRRLRRGNARPADGDVPEPILAVSTDAFGFASLGEGQRVRYQHDAGLGEGALVEKCRFGALVARADGIVVGVGFRRVWAMGEPEQN